MENILLPTKVEFLQGKSPYEGDLIITPCYFGYGTTLGNALRRVILSSLPGAAVEAFKIKGVQHEFAAIDGVKEDVVEIILNLKQLAVRVYSDDPVVLKLNKKGKGELTAGDFESNADAEVINKDLILATLTTDKEFEMEIIVGRGRGFKTAEDKNKKEYDLGTIVIDSIYNPVKDVGYSVEYTRVGDITNYEKLSLHIETDGTITPEEAASQATKIIMNHLSIILTDTANIQGGSKVVENIEVVEPEEKIEVAEGDAEEVKEEKPKKPKKVKKSKTKK